MNRAKECSRNQLDELGGIVFATAVSYRRVAFHYSVAFQSRE